MTIESITGKTYAQPAIKTPQKDEIDSGNKASVKSTEKNDSIEITALAQGIKKAFESSSVTIVDADRVSAVKKSLADGSYQIDAEKIAKKMIQFEKLMP